MTQVIISKIHNDLPEDVSVTTIAGESFTVGPLESHVLASPLITSNDPKNYLGLSANDQLNSPIQHHTTETNGEESILWFHSIASIGKYKGKFPIGTQIGEGNTDFGIKYLTLNLAAGNGGFALVGTVDTDDKPPIV